MSIYRWLASAFLIIILLVPALAVSLVASETGSRWLLEQSQQYLPLNIHYDEFHGTLLNEFQFENFQIKSDSFSYASEQLEINWQPFALLSGILRVNNIKSLGGEIRIRAARNDNESSDTEGSLRDIKIELPLNIDIRNATIQQSKFFIVDIPPQTLTIHASARLSTEGLLDIKQFLLEHQYLTTSLSGTTQLSYPFENKINNKIHLHSPDYPSVRVQSQITGDIQRLTTKSEFSDSLKGSLTAQVLKPLEELSWELNSQWQENDLSQWLASFGAGKLTLNFSGAIQGQGGLTQASVQPDISVTVNQQTADVDGNIDYQDNTVIVTPLNIRPKGDIQGQLALNGSISSLNTTPLIDASLVWNKISYQPTNLSSKNGELQAQGTMNDLTVYLNNELSGLLDKKIGLITQAKLKPESLSISKLQLTQNDETVSGNAVINWKKNLSVAAELSGQFQQRPLDAEVNLRLSNPYLFVDQFNANWGAQSFQADGALSPGRKLNWRLESADLNAIAAIKGEFLASGRISGQLNQPEFELNIDTFNLNHPDYNAINLDEPVAANFNYKNITFNLTPVCLTYEGVNNPLCVQLEHQGDSINFDADASQVPLGLLQALIVPDVAYNVSGDLSAQVSGSLNYKTMQLSDVHAVVHGNNSQVQAAEKSITLNQLKLTANSQAEEGIDIALTAVAQELDFDLSGQVTIDKITADSSLTGEITLNSESLELLNIFVPQADIENGNINAKLEIAGNLSDPAVSGEAHLSANRLVVFASGTLISDLNAELTADANVGQFTVNADGKIGEGDFTIKGKLDAFERAGQLTVNGTDLLILDTPDLLLVASPDVNVELEQDALFIKGNLNIPKARITPIEMNQAVSESADVTLKNETKEPPLFLTHTDVTVSLGKEVRVEALGFAGNLKGKLQITKQPDSGAHGNGSIGVVSGDYEIYGQELAIERGDLLFNGGPLDTPFLNLRVTRQIEQSGVSQNPPETIGARVTGTIKQPELSLFSTPSLPDSTILSYLLFGKPPGTQGDVNNLELQAALLVGGRSTRFLTEGLKNTFDLDEVSLDSETSDVNDTSLYIGKYLSPRLYIKYGIGLIESTSTFILRYTLSERLLFESTSTTEGQGGDLIYTIEN